jgi:hypothetical protein
MLKNKKTYPRGAQKVNRVFVRKYALYARVAPIKTDFVALKPSAVYKVSDAD